MHLELSPTDAALLTQLIQSRLDELGPEVHHTDNRDFRDDLKAQRTALQKVMQQMQQAATCTT
jgi:hypothetical protein